MADWTQVAEKAISVKVQTPPEAPTIELSLSANEVKPTDTVQALITIKNPNNTEVSGTIYLGYVENQQFKTIAQKSVTVGANSSTSVTLTFTPEDAGMQAGQTYDVGVQGKFTINGNTITTSSNVVSLTVEQPQEIQPPVLHLSVNKTSVNVGDTVVLTLTVKNPNSQSGTFTGTLTYNVNGTVKNLVPNGWSNVTIGPGETKTLTYSFAPQEAGTYTFLVNGTLTVGTVQKSATSNAVTVTVNKPSSIAEPTLDISVSPTSVTAGGKVTVSVTLKNNDSSHTITSASVQILVNGTTVKTLTLQNIAPGKSAGASAEITLDTPGQNQIQATAKVTFDTGDTMSVASKVVTVTVTKPAGKDFSVTLSYPQSITAGDSFSVTVLVENIGSEKITSAQGTYALTQYDQNGNVVATYNGNITFGEIDPGQSSSQVFIIVTKNVPGTISGNVSVTATFADGTTLSKSATMSITVNAPGSTPSNEGTFSGIVEFVTTHPILVGLGLVGLLLLTRHEQPRVIYAQPGGEKK